jgi:hypothetical protein
VTARDSAGAKAHLRGTLDGFQTLFDYLLMARYYCAPFFLNLVLTFNTARSRSGQKILANIVPGSGRALDET